MLKIPTYSIRGTKLEETVLPKDFFPQLNLDLLAQAVHVFRKRAHVGLSSVKTRAQINRTKKKWYKQKGTGGARHGAKSAPIFVGGGVAHGPKPIRRTVKIPRKMRRQALFQAVALKLSDPGAVVAVGGMEKLGKTKEAQTFLAKVAGGKSCLLVLAEKNATAKRFWQNLTKVRLVFFRNLNAWLIKQNQVVIFDREIFNRKETKK